MPGSANARPAVSISGFDADPTLPSDRKIAHGRTVTDPLEGYWEGDLLPLLEKDSTLQAVTLLRHLQALHPLAFPDDRIRRTLERRIRQWRALNGPERDIIFRQTPEPGYMAQSDFTHADDLGVVIAGQPFPHLLYHFVMVYSRCKFVGGNMSASSLAVRASRLWPRSCSRRFGLLAVSRETTAPTASRSVGERSPGPFTDPPHLSAT